MGQNLSHLTKDEEDGGEGGGGDGPGEVPDGEVGEGDEAGAEGGAGRPHPHVVVVLVAVAGLLEGVRPVVARRVAHARDEHLAQRRVHVEEEGLSIGGNSIELLDFVVIKSFHGTQSVASRIPLKQIKGELTQLWIEL